MSAEASVAICRLDICASLIGMEKGRTHPLVFLFFVNSGFGMFDEPPPRLVSILRMCFHFINRNENEKGWLRRSVGAHAFGELTHCTCLVYSLSATMGKIIEQR